MRIADEPPRGRRCGGDCAGCLPAPAAVGLFLALLPAADRGPLPDHAQIELAGGGIVSYQISYYDPQGTLVTMAEDATNADLSRVPAIIRPATAWPRTAVRPDAVSIAYQISDMPPDDVEMVRQAMRLLVGHWYANREAVVDTRGTPAELPMTVSWLPSRCAPGRSEPWTITPASCATRSPSAARSKSAMGKGATTPVGPPLPLVRG
jgi:hypothetical protein